MSTSSFSASPFDAPKTIPGNSEASDESEKTLLNERICELEAELAQCRKVEGELRASETKYRTLVESSPYCIKLIDLQGNLLSMNRSGLEMVGAKTEQDIIGRYYMKVVCEADFQRVESLLKQAVKGNPCEFDFLASTGSIFRSNFVPITDDNGTIVNLLSITQDVTDQRRLVDELDHRVKNNLAAVLALSEQTRSSSESLDAFTTAFEGRILALSRSHEALAHSHWVGIAFPEIAGLALHAHVPPDSDQLQIVGAEKNLLPARICGPLTLTLHEMATNALKYGALSTEDGRLRLEYSIDDENLKLCWTESRNTPTLAADELKFGVGLNLIQGFITHELHGEFDVQMTSDGLVANMSIPLGDSSESPVSWGSTSSSCNTE